MVRTETDVSRGGLNPINWILLALLALQLVVVAFVLWPREPTSRGGGPLLAGLDIGSLVGLAVSDSEGGEVSFERGEEGWTLLASGYPASEEKIQNVLEAIAQLRTDRLIARTERSHERLRVATDDFVRRIELETEAGATQQLYLGSQPRSNATHIRLDGRSETYLGSDLASYQVTPRVTSWIDPIYLRVDRSSLASIRLQNANADLTFNRDEQETWTLEGLQEGEELLTANVNTLAIRISSVRMVEPLGTTREEWFGLDDPLARVTVSTRQTDEESGEVTEQTITLLVGAEDEEGNHVFHSSTSPFYITITDFTARDFLDKTRQDYLRELEEEAGEAADGVASP